jgi:pimeloyl-ACP methyl ester carboxylesterase
MKSLKSNLKPVLLVSILFVLSVFQQEDAYAQYSGKFKKSELSDAALIKKVPGFTNGYAQVNGIKVHYVTGGQGEPLVLLPGWPETWWSYHNMMPILAKKYKVIVVDIRGMGTTDKPANGYDKKTIAEDIYELVKKLGYDKVNMAGHDIGAQVAHSFAANHPEATAKLVILDVPHPDPSWLSIPLLPAKGTFTNKLDPAHPYLWWFAFHQVKEMPEKILAGRVYLEHDWFFKYMLVNEKAVDDFDKAVYANAYDSPDGIRAGNEWYQAFNQDIDDFKTYKKLEMPVLGIGGPGYGWLAAVLPSEAVNVKVMEVKDSGHFIGEEKPQEVATFIIDFLK